MPQLLLALCVSFLFVPSWADLPVDCKHHEIVGDWIFEIGPLDKDKSVQCHTGGSLEVTMYGSSFSDADLGTKCAFKTKSKVQVKLSDPFHAIAVYEDGSTVKGRWTMVYNEAFEVKLENGRSFLGFSLFETSGGDGANKCDQTWPGRTMDLAEPDAKTYGCFVAYKSHSKNICHGGKLPKRGLRSQVDGDSTYYADASTFLQVGVTNGDEELYQHEDSFIATLNEKAAGRWTAARYPELEEMTLLQIQQRMGIRRSKQSTIKRGNEHNTAVTPQDLERLGLPKNFDWRDVDGENYVDDVIEQICGSCYAASTVSQINCRTRIATGNAYKAQFDYKQILQCDRYNQGCAGGYPYLALKYALEFGLSESSASGETPTCPKGALPHTNTGTPIDMNGYTTSEAVVRVTDYDYIGGFYGGVTAGGILKDVYERGPVSVGIGGSLELLHYKSGIFRQTMTNHILYDFEAVGHAVLVVGWVTSEDGKEVHYIVKNSYGEKWGEGGFFRTNEFVAGINSEHIESLVASGKVMVVPGSKADVSKPSHPLKGGAGASAAGTLKHSAQHGQKKQSQGMLSPSKK